MTPRGWHGEMFDPHCGPPALKKRKEKKKKTKEVCSNGTVEHAVVHFPFGWRKTRVSYLCRLTLSVLPCCCDRTAGTGCGVDGSRKGKVTTCCRCCSRGTGCCRAGGESVSRSGDSAAGSGRCPSMGSSAVSATAVQTPWKQTWTSPEPPDRQPS